MPIKEDELGFYDVQAFPLSLAEALGKQKESISLNQKTLQANSLTALTSFLSPTHLQAHTLHICLQGKAKILLMHPEQCSRLSHRKRFLAAGAVQFLAHQNSLITITCELTPLMYISTGDNDAQLTVVGSEINPSPSKRWGQHSQEQQHEDLMQ